MKLINKRFGYMFMGLGGVGYYLLVYMFKKLTDEGVRIDETHGNGEISLGEIGLCLIGLLLVVIGIVAFYQTLVRGVSEHKETDKAMRRVKTLALWSLIFSGFSLIAYWFAVLAVALGVAGLMFAIDLGKAKRAGLPAYIVISLFSIVGALLHVLLVFTAR